MSFAHQNMLITFLVSKAMKLPLEGGGPGGGGGGGPLGGAGLGGILPLKSVFLELVGLSTGLLT